MIKGGFQGLDISGVDLTTQSPTLPGAYAACAAADGKPIRVLTADGAVQCSVKKVSTNYVLAGVTGDGKILSITVGSTDGISMSETEIPEEAANEYLDIAVDFASSTSSEPYITEFDGLVRLYYTGTEALSSEAVVSVKVGAAQNTGATFLRLPVGAISGENKECFIKKGTKIWATKTDNAVNAKFYPYKPVQS